MDLCLLRMTKMRLYPFRVKENATKVFNKILNMEKPILILGGSTSRGVTKKDTLLLCPLDTCPIIFMCIPHIFLF